MASLTNRAARRAARLLCGLVLACIGGVGPARAATDDPPTLVLTPASIAATTAVETEILSARLRLRAPPDAALQEVDLSSFSNDGITVAIADGTAAAPIASLAADDEHVWALRLTPTRPLARTAHVIFEVAFTEQRQDKPAVRRHLYATLQVEPPPAAAPDTLVGIEVSGGEAVLSRERPGTIYLVLRNKRARDLQVTDLRWFKPDFIDLIPNGVDCAANAAPAAATPPYALRARDSVVVPVLVCPGERVVPGKYGLLATAHVAAAGVGLGTLSASREVEIGVLGESELLNLLGVPSLLLLPGFMLLVTWRILNSLSPAGGGEFFLKPKEPDFWAVAIALSLGFAFAYPWLTGKILAEGRRDYLVAYGLRDLVYVYASAIVIGVLAFLLWRLQMLARAAYAAAELTRTAPVAGDAETEILRKLGDAGAPIDLPIAHLTGTAEDQTLFILSPWSSAETIWLAPPVKLKIKDPFADAEEGRDANNALARATTGGDVTAAEAHRIVSNGATRGWWTVSWATVGAVNGPIAKKPDEVKRLNRRRRIVEEA